MTRKTCNATCHDVNRRGPLKDMNDMLKMVCMQINTSFKLKVNLSLTPMCEGAQWLSGRVLDSRPKGRGFQPHRRQCVVVLEQDTFILA